MLVGTLSKLSSGVDRWEYSCSLLIVCSLYHSLFLARLGWNESVALHAIGT